MSFSFGLAVLDYFPNSKMSLELGFGTLLLHNFCIKISVCDILSTGQVSISRLEKWKICMHILMYVKVSLHTCCVCYNLVHSKIGYIHGIHNLYVIEVFMNAHNLHFTLNIFLLVSKKLPVINFCW